MHILLFQSPLESSLGDCALNSPRLDICSDCLDEGVLLPVALVPQLGMSSIAARAKFWVQERSTSPPYLYLSDEECLRRLEGEKGSEEKSKLATHVDRGLGDSHDLNYQIARYWRTARLGQFPRWWLR